MLASLQNVHQQTKSALRRCKMLQMVEGFFAGPAIATSNDHFFERPCIRCGLLARILFGGKHVKHRELGDVIIETV